MNSLLIALNAIKRTFSKKLAIVKLIIIPIVSVYFILGLGSSRSSDMTAIIIDNDNSKISAKYIEEMKEKHQIKILESYDDINSSIIDGKAHISLEIEEGFENAILNGGKPQIDVTSLKGSQVTTWIVMGSDDIIKSMKAVAENSENEEQLLEEYAAFKAAKIKVAARNVDYQGNNVSALSMSIGVLLMFMMYNAFRNTKMMVEDKYSRTYYRICSSPVSFMEYTMGVLIFSLSIVVIQVTAVVIMMFTTRSEVINANPIVIFVILLVFSICSIAFGMLIVAFSGGYFSAESAVVNLSCMISGCFFPYEIMPEFMRKLSYVFPQRWTILAVQNAQMNSGLIEVAKCVGVVGLFACICFMLTAIKMGRAKTTASKIA